MASNSTSAELLAGESMMYHNFTLTVATFFFGGYSVLILLSTRMMLKRGLKTQSLRVLFFVGLFMYIITATFWTYSLVYVVGIVQAYIDPQNDQWTRFATQTSHPVSLFDAIVLVNFVLSDGIVCWRSWVISRRDYPKLIVLPVVFWASTILSTTALIIIRIGDNPNLKAIRDSKPLVRAIEVLQLQNMTTSLLSNVSATGLIGATAWRHRRVMKDNFYNLQGHKLKQSRATQAMVLLIESGVLYCLTGVLGTTSQLIHLPFGTLNDIILSANIQFAGAYAPTLLLLISNHQSEDSGIEYLGTLPISMPNGTLAAPQMGRPAKDKTFLQLIVTAGLTPDANLLAKEVSRKLRIPGMDKALAPNLSHVTSHSDYDTMRGLKKCHESFETITAALDSSRPIALPWPSLPSAVASSTSTSFDHLIPFCHETALQYPALFLADPDSIGFLVACTRSPDICARISLQRALIDACAQLADSREREHRVEPTSPGVSESLEAYYRDTKPYIYKMLQFGGKLKALAYLYKVNPNCSHLKLGQELAALSLHCETTVRLFTQPDTEGAEELLEMFRACENVVRNAADKTNKLDVTADILHSSPPF
ncbi:hypothetical protein FB45DRAFT_1063243 [Roridomyces roridus]|uniref:Uncharacterized protein n=1 Tax=Roridomyces roridus TaxID=1738132 RepID=A0AAD7FGB1_9AGAR|nr:hypothetical protein FB45DRAFT_1063243 [Roridomyces roridus]